MTSNLISALLVSSTLLALGAGTVIGLPHMIGHQQQQQPVPVVIDLQ